MPPEEHPPKPGSKRKRALDPDAVRMSFGEHLEELRTRLIRALLGSLVGIGIAVAFAKPVVRIICDPLYAVLARHHLQPTVYGLHVGEGFTVWIKAVLIGGLLLASPWVIHQMWQFVAVGLYARERRFVQLSAPVSIGLFLLGVVFMYFVVLPVALEFFVTFNIDFGVPDLPASTASQPAQTQPADAIEPLPRIPILAQDPRDPPDGAVWFNPRGILNFKAKDGIYIQYMTRRDQQSAITPLFGLEFYISFFMGLSLAFGLAFQLPVVVVFLAMVGIVSTQTMAKSRKYVIFIITIAAAVLTPTTDVLSMMLLAVPMVGLFEAGLMVARLLERARARREALEQGTP
ncbi:MAG TPA: twin-arginine translocase subunit TatC [Phycisphaerae bacterium]|jgi:sec-independent protein translocase protein TatC